jgi:hypothetical protein
MWNLNVYRIMASVIVELKYVVKGIRRNVGVKIKKVLLKLNKRLKIDEKGFSRSCGLLCVFLLLRRTLKLHL